MTGKIGPGDRKELQRRLDSAWAELAAAYRSAAPAALSASPQGGGWSAKDHLAHISVWLKVIAARIDGKPENQIFGMDLTTFWNSNTDQLNEAAQRLNAGRGAGDVLRELREMHASVSARIGKLTDAQLARPTWPDRPERGQLVDAIVGDTYAHYIEHVPDIRRLLGR
ncbi:MAG: DinB family protein [Chloroflexi bacterium]|nr:DinB family protein [Chloroflexota bacterium]